MTRFSKKIDYKKRRNKDKRKRGLFTNINDFFNDITTDIGVPNNNTTIIPNANIIKSSSIDTTNMYIDEIDAYLNYTNNINK